MQLDEPRYHDVAAQIVPGKKNSRDNDVVCRTTESTGSRLTSDRRCLTRLEWQMRDAQYKQEIGTALKDLRTAGKAGGG